MACIPPNPRRVGYVDPIHGPLDGSLYMGSHIHQHFLAILAIFFKMLYLLLDFFLNYSGTC